MNIQPNPPKALRPGWVVLRSPRDIDALDRAAHLAWAAARAGLAAAHTGVLTSEVGDVIRSLIECSGGRPAFDGYCVPGVATPFHGPACISVNEEAVHTPPGGRVLAAGDLVTVDVGVEFDGWYGDVAESLVVPGVIQGTDATHTAERLLRACRCAVAGAVRECGPGVWWSSVARVVRSVVTAHECMVLPGFTGHGVGRVLHEPPRAGYGVRAGDQGDFLLMPGMVLTIEPIVVGLPGRVEHASDGWSVRTADGSPACHIERMIAITRQGTRILGLPGGCMRESDGL